MPRPWTTSDFDRALPLLRRGWEIKRIAALLGVSMGTTANKLARYRKRVRV